MNDHFWLVGIGVALVLALVVWFVTRKQRTSQEPFTGSAPPANESIKPIGPTVIEQAAPAPDSVDVEVRMLIDYGNKIAAIRVVREKLGLDLKEAKELVDAMESGRPIPLAGNSAAPQAQNSADHELRQLVSAGRLIEAIKLAREQKGLDLKAAKAYVERL